mmetsp:Transcript_21697/g.26295  ORF Transcript_21697/g.26295 Transcript_21697/m.26295 type:complete len:88 (-) Transcript_21697:200-463(-)
MKSGVVVDATSEIIGISHIDVNQEKGEVSRWLSENGLEHFAYNAEYHNLNSFEDTRRMQEQELFSMLLVKSAQHKNILRNSPLMNLQ